jgi:hypothetical protein
MPKLPRWAKSGLFSRCTAFGKYVELMGSFCLSTSSALRSSWSCLFWHTKHYIASISIEEEKKKWREEERERVTVSNQPGIVISKY